MSRKRRAFARETLRANLFDGDEGGTTTYGIARLLTDIVDVLDDDGLLAVGRPTAAFLRRARARAR